MTRPTERVARVRTAAFALVSALVGILLALPCFSRVPLAFTQNGPQQEGRVKITVHVLRAEGGDPLPGIRVNFLNLRTRNQGFRVSKDDGLCDAYWVPAGTRLEITPTNPRYDFGEAGSDNIMRSSLVVTANRDQDLYFKGRALGRGTPRAAESRPVEAETAIPGLAYGAEHAYVSMRNGPMPPGVTPQQWAWRILYEQAYESLVDDPPIWSLRLSLTTGTSSYAGTDSGVFIQFFLPKRQAWSKKFYLDRHQDDFRPGARAGYYLLVPEIARLSDLGSDQATMKIGLDGQDDWELTSFSLEINDKVINDN